MSVYQLDRLITEMIDKHGYAYTCGFLQSQLRAVIENQVAATRRDRTFKEIAQTITESMKR